jgi:chromosome segregation ATPase
MSEQERSPLGLSDRLADRPSSYDNTSMVLSLEAQVNALSAERAELFTRLGVFDTNEVISMVEALREQNASQAEAHAHALAHAAEATPVAERSVVMVSADDPGDVDVDVPSFDVQQLADRMGDVGPTMRRLQDSMGGLDERRSNHVADIARLRGEIERQRNTIGEIDAERNRLATRMTSIADAVSNLDSVMGADW